MCVYILQYICIFYIYIHIYTLILCSYIHLYKKTGQKIRILYSSSYRLQKWTEKCIFTCTLIWHEGSLTCNLFMHTFPFLFVSLPIHQRTCTRFESRHSIVFFVARIILSFYEGLNNTRKEFVTLHMYTEKAKRVDESLKKRNWGLGRLRKDRSKDKIGSKFRVFRFFFFFLVVLIFY